MTPSSAPVAEEDHAMQLNSEILTGPVTVHFYLHHQLLGLFKTCRYRLIVVVFTITTHDVEALILKLTDYLTLLKQNLIQFPFQVNLHTLMSVFDMHVHGCMFTLRVKHRTGHPDLGLYYVHLIP